MESPRLTESQDKIMKLFYSLPKTKVIFTKKQRDLFWKLAIKNSIDSNLIKILKNKVPALAHQIEKSQETNKYIQPAVFSECVYSQTLANMFQLKMFVNCFEDKKFIPEEVCNLIKKIHLNPRYVYSDFDKNKLLIQAGGCPGIDCALFNSPNSNIFTIEYKEQSAKTSEPDLPKYGEDGYIITNDEQWLNKNMQFKEMLKYQEGLNFFKSIGHNINDFPIETIMYAISNNYTDKNLDVICTEDSDGFLVMLPANQVQKWAHIEGEIRPAGRNHYHVWSPNALKENLLKINALFYGKFVTVPKNNLEVRRERGSNGKISGYKINPIFFVYINDCNDNMNGTITFDISNVQQLNPTITAKVFFKSLKYNEVKKYYDF